MYHRTQSADDAYLVKLSATDPPPDTDVPTVNASALSSFARCSFISGTSQYRVADASSTWPRSSPSRPCRCTSTGPHPRRGLQFLATGQSYNCNGAPGNAVPFQVTPRYGCTENWATSVNFADCWNKLSLEEQVDGVPTTVNSQAGVCPAGYPYRIPRINFLAMHRNLDGAVPNPLRVSAGVDEWHDYTFMHADYFAASQPVFDNELLDLCLRDAPDSVTFADLRCGEGA